VEVHRVGIAIDFQSHRRRRTAFHDQHVDSGLLHAQRERAAAGRIADAAGEGTLADNREAVRLRGHGTVEGTGREDQRIRRSQRVDTRLGPVVEQPGAIALAADVEPSRLLVEGREAKFTLPEVHLENPAGVSLDHRGTPLAVRPASPLCLLPCAA